MLKVTLNTLVAKKNVRRLRRFLIKKAGISPETVTDLANLLPSSGLNIAFLPQRSGEVNGKPKEEEGGGRLLSANDSLLAGCYVWAADIACLHTLSCIKKAYNV